MWTSEDKFSISDTLIEGLILLTMVMGAVAVSWIFFFFRVWSKLV